MSNQERLVTYGVSFLHGVDYALWKVRMDGYLMSLDLNIFLSVEYDTHDKYDEESKKIIMKGLLDCD